MPLTCSATCRNSRAFCCLCALSIAAVGVTGCGPQRGLVGRQNAPDAGTIFESEFKTSDGPWSIEAPLPGASATFGNTDMSARDGFMAKLVFPGDAALASTDNVGPDFVTQLQTTERFGFGTLRSRVKFGGCSGTEEVVQAVLGYFSDGLDHNQNGITDDIEIDLQIACSSREFAYLSVFTDYQADPAGDRFRKLSHVVDFSTGTEYDTPADNSDTLVKSGTNPSLLRPNLLNSGNYYEVGYEWHTNSVRFFLVDGAESLTLWTLSDPTHVPQLPVYLTYNMWHPSTHWFPLSGDADYPANDVVMDVDWVRFEPSKE